MSRTYYFKNEGSAFSVFLTVLFYLTGLIWWVAKILRWVF